MSMLDKMADIFFHPAQAIWSIFAVGGSFLLFFILLQTNLQLATFYLALGVLTLAGLVTLPTTFKDAAENSVDWNERVESNRTAKYLVVGLFGLGIASTLIGVLAQGSFTPLSVVSGATSLLWVPRNLLPLEAASVSFKFTSDVFATVFAVVPGEESLKTLFTPLFKAYEQTSWADKLPFALQPAIVTGVSFWSALHVILLQQPWFFFFTAFFAGEIMMWMSALSGAYLNSWLIHALWNIGILLITYFMVIK